MNKGEDEMEKNSLKFTVTLVLAAVSYLPGMAFADYVRTWMKNVLDGNSAYPLNLGHGLRFMFSPGTLARSGYDY